MSSFRIHGTRNGARAAVGTLEDVPVMVDRTWMFPVRIVPPVGPMHPAALVPLKVGGGTAAAVVQ